MEATIQARQTGHDLDDRSTLIAQWPERIGTAEWRKRAAKELSPTEHEAFLFYAGTAKELSQEECEAISREWELFNVMRAKQLRRQETIRKIVEAFDAGAAVVSFFGVFGLIAWYFSPTMFESGPATLWLYFHLTVMGAWGISLLARLPSALRALRDMLNDWKMDRSSKAAIARPLRYADDRIEAVEFEGRKYRSNALLTKAVQESQERDRNVRAGQEVLKRGTGHAFNLIAYIFMALLVLGGNGLLDMHKGYMPLWLSIVLTILGGVGFFLVVRLRDRLRREADVEVSDTPLTPAPMMRGRRAATSAELMRRAANLNEVWRLGGAGERVPFAADPRVDNGKSGW